MHGRIVQAADLDAAEPGRLRQRVLVGPRQPGAREAAAQAAAEEEAKAQEALEAQEEEARQASGKARQGGRQVKARRAAATMIGICLAAVAALAMPVGAQAAFGIAGFSVTALNRNGTPDLQAGSHPYEFSVKLQLNLDSEGNLEGKLRDLIADLPTGMIGNPQAVPPCSGADFEGVATHCPGDTQVGVAYVRVAGSTGAATVPVYNLTPPPGIPGEIGFAPININSFQEATLRPDDYGIRISDLSVPSDKPIESIIETIWGVPAEASHDALRFCPVPGTADQLEQGCRSQVPPEAFLSLPTSCAGPLAMNVSVHSVEGAASSTSAYLPGNGGLPEGLSGCERLPFSPSLSVQPQTGSAESPTGLDFHLHVPQTQLSQAGDPEGTATATANLKDTTVDLPAGLAVNPSTADGLQACSEAQIGFERMSGGRAVFSGAPPSCPSASKIGTVEVSTPLLDHVVPGTVYIASQGANPFGSLIALYIVLDDPFSGVLVKLAAEVQTDDSTGQLRAVVRQNPQLPFEDFTLDFMGGPRGSLTTPSTCGTYTTTSDLVPWTSPAGLTVHPSDSFRVTSSSSGGGCPGSESQKPNSPSFEAGTATPLAGAYSPFVLKLSRENGSQRFGAVNVQLPLGLTGRIAGTSECSDAQIARATGRSNPGEGALEQADPSCPASSEIGTVTVGAGSGTPLYVQGRAYLAGPYRGAPLSMVIVTPAIAGPFDLGAVVVRSALYVNEETGQITVKSDPIPTILDGVPLDVRSVAVSVSKNQFTLNPTSCEASSLTAEAISTTGQVAHLQNRFQVGGCRGLEFHPQVQLQLKGQTKRAGHPKLKAVVSFPHKVEEANATSIQVGLPHALFLDQGNLNKVCTRPELASHSCPSTSVYGHVKAYTPLFEEPLTGPVYLGVGFGYKLPALVTELNGKVRIIAHGRVDTTKQHGLRNTFEFVPDAPVSQIVLEMKGGKKYGLLENSENLCSKAQQASARLVAHNGVVAQLHPKIAVQCNKKGKK
jgi:hypothetical protein